MTKEGNSRLPLSKDQVPSSQGDWKNFVTMEKSIHRSLSRQKLEIQNTTPPASDKLIGSSLGVWSQLFPFRDFSEFMNETLKA